MRGATRRGAETTSETATKAQLIVLIATALFLTAAALPITAQAQDQPPTTQDAIGCCRNDEGVGSLGKYCVGLDVIQNDTSLCQDGGYLPDQDCTQVPACEEGCCCGPTLSKPGSLGHCTFLNETLETDQGLIAFAPGANQDCVAVCEALQLSTNTTNETTGNETQTEETFYIAGTVTDQHTATPIQGANVYARTPSSPYHAVTDEQGNYIITGVPADPLQLKVYADHDQCSPDSTLLQPFLENHDDVDFSLDCTAQNCLHAIPEIVRLAAVPNEPKNIIQWEFQNTCRDLQGFVLLSCDETWTGCDGYPLPPETSSFTDPPSFAPQLPNETRCYQVIAQFFDGTTTQTDQIQTNCIAPPDPQCIKPHTPDFCENNTRKTCDENNNVVTIQTCASTEVCTYKTPTKSNQDHTTCEPQAPCDQCNGPFGLFAHVLQKLGIGIPYQSLLNWPCQNLERVCYSDVTPTPQDAYRSCADVTTCYDYTSYATCSADPCQKFNSSGLNGCVWKRPTPGFPEVGKGVCVPKDAALQQCERCNDIFGSCNKNLCEQLGECYYDELPNNLRTETGFTPTCRNRREMACRYYDTKEDCIGPSGSESSITVNITFNNQGEAIGGDHAILTRSNDLFARTGHQEGFGHCEWISGYGDFCIKNSDGHTQGFPRDDCVEAGFASTPLYPDCLRDTQPPTTTILLKQGEPYGLDELTAIPYYVSDNLYSADYITTYACLVPAGETCHPNNRVQHPTDLLPLLLDAFNLDAGASGTYTIWYYSKDPSGNYEQPRSANIDIQNTTKPYITNVTIT